MKMHIEDNMNREQIQKAVDAACVLGMTHTEMQFPCFEKIGNEPNDSVFSNRREIPENYQSSTLSAKETDDLFYKNMHLESLFRVGSFLKDCNHDGLPDTCNFSFVLPEKPSASVIRALMDVCVRFAMDSTSINTENLLLETDEIKNRIIFTGNGNPGMHLCTEDGREILKICGEGEELEQFISLFCQTFDDHRNHISMEETTWQLRQAFKGLTYDGQKPYIAVHGKDAVYYADIPYLEESGLADRNVQLRTSAKEAGRIEREISSETEELMQVLQKAMPAIDRQKPMRIYGALSKDKTERESTESRIKELLPDADVHILNAYKPGFSWIEEICMPELQRIQTDRIVISFKPFLKPGAEWHDEDGAIPKKGTPETDENSWLELPIRFLQELYPVDDLIQEKTGLDRNSIIFKADEHMTDTYRLQAFSNNQIVYEDSYAVHVYERSYLDAFPQAGKVHPDTGYLKVEQRGKTILDTCIMTDRDRIWDMFQSEVLPMVSETVKKEHPAGISCSDQPLFMTLRLEIQISETERQLNSRQDIIMPIDALQEDLYFAALDYFKYFGRQECTQMLDAPGLIVPNAELRKGPASFTAVLEQPQQKHPCMIKDGCMTEISPADADAPVSLMGVEYRNQKLCYVYETGNMDPAYLDSFCSMLQNDQLHLSHAMNGLGYCQFAGSTADMCALKQNCKDRTIDEVDLYPNEVIGYDQYAKIINQLKRVKGIAAVPLAYSMQNRTVYGICFEKERKGYVSRTKQICDKPSVVVICRHHANEVSSTNSSLQLIHALLTDDSYKDIPDKMNLLIIPMENPDGAAIHYELQKKHPFNKLHVARYNAAGREFAHETFHEDTVHKEAHAMLRAYREMLPDAIIDDHGVPSHEWEQPYSGYTSPLFKGFWLPRSILYGYFWTVSNHEYRHNEDLCIETEKAVAQAVMQLPENIQYNTDWQDRFEKYAHAWMPKLFPAVYRYGMIHYWIQKEQSSSQLYFSQRFPWITTMYYTSEAADETAQGSYLRGCAKTHLTEDIAILRLMKDTQAFYNKCYQISDRGIQIGLNRMRPIQVHKD